VNKKMIAIVIAVLALTFIVSAVHLKNQEPIACMVIKTKDGTIPVAFEELSDCEFTGSLMNGKGEVSEHTYTGILLKDLLKQKGIAVPEMMNVCVISADHYSARFTSAEVNDDAKVYIAVAVDGAPMEGIDPETKGVQVIAFGDKDSRRCVRYAAVIEIGPDAP